MATTAVVQTPGATVVYGQQTMYGMAPPPLMYNPGYPIVAPPPMMVYDRNDNSTALWVIVGVLVVPIAVIFVFCICIGLLTPPR